MYKIKVINKETGIIFSEYGFPRYMMKRIHFFAQEVGPDNYSIYEIMHIYKLAFSFKTFKKCLTNATEL